MTGRCCDFRHFDNDSNLLTSFAKLFDGLSPSLRLNGSPNAVQLDRGVSHCLSVYTQLPVIKLTLVQSIHSFHWYIRSAVAAVPRAHPTCPLKVIPADSSRTWHFRIIESRTIFASNAAANFRLSSCWSLLRIDQCDAKSDSSNLIWQAAAFRSAQTARSLHTRKPSN